MLQSIGRVVLLVTYIALWPVVTHAQSGSALPFSIGQPVQWQQEASALASLRGMTGGTGVSLGYGVYRALVDPVAGLLGITGEAYVADRDGAALGGHLFATARALGLSAGIDWNARPGNVAPILSFQSAILRGGILTHGSMVRVDWLPTRSQSVSIGLTVPLFQPLAGRTRPRQSDVHLSSGSSPNELTVPVRAAPAGAPLNDIIRAVDAIAGYTNAYSDRAVRTIARTGLGYTQALALYDAGLVKLFGSVSDDATARRVVHRGRIALFDRVVLPLDSLFGQAKADPRDLTPLTNAATAEMRRWLNDSSNAPAAAKPALLSAFADWMNVIGRVNGDLLGDAKDSRLVWLPLKLALEPADYDGQAKLDSLIARAVGHPFTDRNALTYLRTSDLPLEIARSIYAARDYHVLWTHDFTGRRVSGAIDNIGYSMVADAYLPALTAAVKRYDSTGVFPTYVILQDQFFYEPRDNRLWMTILEDPLHASMRLRGDSGQREAHLRARQTALRAAVASSTRLQAAAAASGEGERWLRGLIKVHVNIVEQSDFSFRSSHIIPGLPFTPDNVMRDHRKIVFYDLNEADPYRGAMLLMGVGIGEHYASATWEDRGYRLRGPATLEVRRAVRIALIRNGFSEADIPVPLRAVASVRGEEDRMNVGDYVGRTLQVNNEVGFAPKESSVARAMLYDLAPPGSVIIVPDPMWLSNAWAGMLAGAAARGCRVYVIAPAEANAPSPQAPLMALQHDVLQRLLDVRRLLAPQIQGAGGDLRVAVFAAHAQVDDAAGRAREVRQGLVRAPWIRAVIPFDDQTLAVLQQAEATASTGKDATALAHDEKPRAPQLHQKSQLVARPGAIAALVRQPGWDVVLARTIRVESQITARFEEQLGWTNPDIDSTAARSADVLFRGYEQTLPESERKRMSFYFSLGTQNQDTRGIVSDAETTLIVSGLAASAGLADLFELMARSQWIENQTELNAFVPPQSDLLRRIAHFIRAAL